MELSVSAPDSFTVSLHGQPILVHTPEQPLFHVGTCESSYYMRLGHFLIEHKEQKKSALKVIQIEKDGETQCYSVTLADDERLQQFQLKFVFQSDGLQIEFPSSLTTDYIRSVLEGDYPLQRDSQSSNDDPMNHFWFSLQALPFAEEKVYGAGLQFGEDDLRKKVLPIWVSEWYHDHLYPSENPGPRPPAHTTYHPQPMFTSSRGYTFCAYGSAYAQFDFSNEHTHRFYFAAMPYRLELKLHGVNLGQARYPPLPDWVYDGIILSIQGGTDTIDQKLNVMHQGGTRIAGVWAQDWSGKRITSFGKRVFWNWQWNENWYPNLKEKIVEWQQKYDGCRFLAYINPYIAVDGSLYPEAEAKGYLVKRRNPEKTIYIIDFGEFDGAIVDLTNPEAFEWYKQVIRTNLLDLGISGWMADFGEYLPCDVQVHANIPGPLIHNLWPVLWARCNHEAIRDAGKLNEILFFMRSGYLGVQRYCPLFWAGDQAVNFTSDAGLPAGIRASLSLSLSNVLSVHTDIGGYFGRTFGRTQEVLLRWCEMAAFNAVMRTHEGNRPASNIQFDSDARCTEFMARMSRIHAHLKPYARHVVEQAHQQQQSCLIPHSELQYFFGNDLFIAPVTESEVNRWTVSLPKGQWIHLWTNKIFEEGVCVVDAPIGHPPVFYRATSDWKSLFEEFQHL